MSITEGVRSALNDATAFLDEIEIAVSEQGMPKADAVTERLPQATASLRLALWRLADVADDLDARIRQLDARK